MADCIFCKIVAGSIPSEILYSDEKVVAFRDINPQAPVHLLIVPRQHIASLADVPDADTPLIGHMAKIANRMAREHGVAKSGYRVVINCGKDGTQVVQHLHMHLLGGHTLSGRMG